MCFDATPSKTHWGNSPDYNLCYLDAGKGFTGFRSKSQLLKLLENHNEMNRFIGKPKLTINNKHPEDIVAVIRYFDGLN